MIALLAAALINLFTLAAPPPDVKPSFALHGFAVVAGERTVTTTAPSFNTVDGEDVIDLSFVAPVTGQCLALQLATLDGKGVYTKIGQGAVNKNATIILTLPLVSAEQLAAEGAVIDGYDVIIVCGDASPKSKALFSEHYHYNPSPKKAS